jgi:RNA polymerase sigma-70 factor (ECF subfamily)
MSPPPRDPDRQRLICWVHDHGRAVRGYLAALVRRPDVADDLVQEVFRRAWQCRERYREYGNSRAYLIRIADRLACDWRREAARAQLQLDDDGWRKVEPAVEFPPEESLAQAEAREELVAALESLSPAQQRVLLLRYYGQLSFAEIAEALGCPLGTALSHCRRGLEALRKLLAEQVS